MATSIKKSTFTIVLWLASHFTENLEQIHTNISISTTFIHFQAIIEIRKKGQKQVKKKAYKINAKTEDVGLNDD